jgi:hydrogenase maturation protease
MTSVYILLLRVAAVTADEYRWARRTRTAHHYTDHMADTLIICVGNTTRGDDGVAHRVAQLLAAADEDSALPADARLLEAAGLDIAMAADVAECTLLIIVDAERRSSPAVEVRDLNPGTAARSGHSIDAPGLLAITRALYDAAPKALLIGVAAPEMGHGETLSPVARAASKEAALVVRDLCSAPRQATN